MSEQKEDLAFYLLLWKYKRKRFHLKEWNLFFDIGISIEGIDKIKEMLGYKTYVL